jgi:hypothetical protein
MEGWIVLEECPETMDGYKIVYDESRGRFGLAMRTEEGELHYLGAYGGFMKTLDAM